MRRPLSPARSQIGSKSQRGSRTGSCQPGVRAINVGATVGLGQILVFVDADDEVAPGYLDAMTDALSRADFVAARMDMKGLSSKWFARTRVSSQQDGGLLDVLRFLPWAGCGTLGITRRAFDAVGGFDEAMPAGALDADFCWRVQLAGYELHPVPAAVLRYRSKTTLLGLYRQSRTYGRGEVVLYRKFRDLGMPRRSAQAVLGDWWYLLSRVPRRPTRANWGWWLHQSGSRVGRLVASIRHRTLYL